MSQEPLRVPFTHAPGPGPVWERQLLYHLALLSVRLFPQRLRTLSLTSRAEERLADRGKRNIWTATVTAVAPLATTVAPAASLHIPGGFPASLSADPSAQIVSRGPYQVG